MRRGPDVVSLFPLIALWLFVCWSLPARAQAPATAPAADQQGRVVAMQGRVEHAAAVRAESWAPAALQQPLFVADRVRTLAASRAAILFIDETQVRLNAGAVLTVQAVRRAPGTPTTLDLVRGEGWFRTKNPASGLTITTPAATAAIRGTEINLSLADDGEAVMTVVEGAAEFFNEAGAVVAVAGEEARARPGEAPTKRAVLNPEDAVQWALYYPVQMARRDVRADGIEGPAALAFARLRERDAAGALSAVSAVDAADAWSRVAAAQAHLDLGNAGEARAALAPLEGTRLDPALEVAYRAERAAVALSEGAVGEASADLDGALALDPAALRPLLLLATLELVRNRADAAAAAVDRARAAHPDSVGALVAASEVAQARFDLPGARRLLDRALALDPDEVRALVNRARLRFGAGDTRGARADISQAARLAQGDAQVRSLQGFIALAGDDVRGAEREFLQAVAADRALAEPHLGLGLVAFRRGRVAEGLEAMLTATLLEPKVSLYQSYLGKAYYQAGRFDQGLAALASAKRLDPRDPTPWLYASLFERDQNRQVAALAELREAIARNDYRAVYRSRLLLDRDEATGNVSLAQVYRQLGFEAWGASEAVTSLEHDFTNASAHLFLAETYGNLPDRTQALGSELLQYFLHAPVNRNTFVNFSEYTALFDQPFRQLSVAPSVGSDGWSRGAIVTRSGHHRVAHYAFVEHEREDGARPGRADFKNQAFLQAKVSITSRDDLFVSVTDARHDDGEGPDVTRVFGLGTSTPIVLRQFTGVLDPNRATQIDTTEGVIGYRRAWRPGSAFTAAWQGGRIVHRVTDPDADVSACSGLPLGAFGARSATRVESPYTRTTFQAQQATRVGRQQVVAGLLLFRQEKERRCGERIYGETTGDVLLDLADVTRGRDRNARGYVRHEVALARWLHASTGLTYDTIDYGDVGGLRSLSLSRWSPLAGVSARLAPRTVLRLAGFRHVAPDFLGAKIAPATVSGFVLERNEFPTTRRDEGNVAIEQGWGRGFVAGRVFLRHAETPLLVMEGLPSPEADVRARGASAFLNLILARRWTLFADDQFVRTTTSVYTRDDHVARVGLSFLHERGVIVRLAGSYFTQRFVESAVEGLPRQSYPLFDLEATHEILGKRGLITVRVANLFDRAFTSALDHVTVGAPRPDRRAYASLRWRF
jgi:tetratricopeptide (TPR) repeat protein